MATPPPATNVPPVEVILSEVVASLALAAHAYLEPAETEERQVDLDAADIALDVAGKAFDRIRARLQESERSAIARLLTDMRLAYVKKRGL